jgi:hypothetical protein
MPVDADREHQIGVLRETIQTLAEFEARSQGLRRLRRQRNVFIAHPILRSRDERSGPIATPREEDFTAAIEAAVSATDALVLTLDPGRSGHAATRDALKIGAAEFYARLAVQAPRRA